MAVQRAQIEHKFSALHTDFAREFVARRFGAAETSLIYSLLPTYSRGPRKGLPKGYVHWDKVCEGGWTRTGGKGHVERPGTRNVRICASRDPDVFYHIPEQRRTELETDEQRKHFIREVLSCMFGRKIPFGIVPMASDAREAA